MVPRHLVPSSSEDCFLAFCKAELVTTSEKLIRPNENISSPGLCGALGDEEAKSVDGDEVQDEIEQDVEHHSDKEINEAAKPRVLRAPTAPSRQEILEHNIAHLSFPGLVRGLREWQEQGHPTRCRKKS